MKIISLSNQKGGVGKTTTAVNLATAVAISGRKVLLVDLDSQGNASTSLGLGVNKRSINIYDVFIGKAEINSAVIVTDIPNLDIITSIVDLASIDKKLIGVAQKELILKQQLSKLNIKYDFIFIDCGPSLGLLTINALSSSHSVIIPLQCEFLAMEGLAYLLGTLKLIQNTINKNLHIEGIVLTMYDKRNKLCVQVEEEVRKEFKNLVYNTTIPRNIKLSESPSHGKPAIMYDTKCSGSISYLMLAQEFINKNLD